MASQDSGSSHASWESTDESTDERKDIQVTQLDVSVLLASFLEEKCVERDGARGNKLFTDVCAYLVKNDVLEPHSCGDQSLRCKQKEILNKIIESMAQNATKEITQVTEQSAAQNTRYSSEFVEIKELGRGGFGKVVEAKHNLDGKSYAVKKISLKPNANMAKPLREVRALARLRHENIMGYSTAWVEDNSHVSASAGFASNASSDSAESTSDDVDEIQELVILKNPPVQKNKKLLCIQMELCNCTLQDWLEERNNKLQNVSIDYGPEDLRRDVIRIFREILYGVSFIHSKGLMHRDLKPQNIFLIGSDLHVKIGDFGFVKGVPGSGSSSVLSSPTVEGVPIDFNTNMSEIWTGFYGSPELLGRRPCNTKCDMYSLGVILFEMCNTFTTGMERHIIMTELQTENHCPESFREMWSESEVDLIERLINCEADCRPTAEEVLLSPMFAKEQQTLPQPVGSLNQRVNKQDQKVKKLDHKSKKQDQKVKKQNEKVQGKDEKFQKQDQKAQGNADQFSREASTDAESMGYRRKQ